MPVQQRIEVLNWMQNVKRALNEASVMMGTQHIRHVMQSVEDLDPGARTDIETALRNARKGDDLLDLIARRKCGKSYKTVQRWATEFEIPLG